MPQTLSILLEEVNAVEILTGFLNFSILILQIA